MRLIPYVLAVFLSAVSLFGLAGCNPDDSEDAGTKTDASLTDTSGTVDTGGGKECDGAQNGTDCSNGVCVNHSCVEKCTKAGNIWEECSTEEGESCYPVGEGKYACWSCGEKDYLETCADMFDCGCNGVCLDDGSGSGYKCWVICKDNTTCTDTYSLNAECVDTELGYSVCVPNE